MRVQKASKQVRFGGDCYLYAMIAMGQMDLGVEAGLKVYDIAALIPIIRGAGGVITSWDGGDPSLGGRIVAAGDQRVHQQALKYLSAVPAGDATPEPTV
jgi:myo-inositol-1(or 4)-monophosphatase